MPHCYRCDRFFSNWHAIEQHKEDSSRHNICFDCDEDFLTWDGLKQHWIQSTRHAYCQYCNEHFDGDYELEEHFEDDHAYCRSCSKVFKNEYGLKQHYRQSSNHNYCADCDRHFGNENNLRNHLRSAIHQPRNSRCPFCSASFVSDASVVQHLEEGACPSGTNRQTVNKIVRQYDRHNIITNPSRLLTAGSDEYITYIANKASWNGNGFECYLCNNTYGSLKALNQHLASPRHQEKNYICRGPSCGIHFSTLSGLWQHIESEKCGVVRFRVVKATMESLLGGMKRLMM